MYVDIEGALDLFRGLPVTLCMFSTIILLGVQIGPASAVHEFTAHRMQQFDLQGTQYGSRSALVNMEARGEQASMISRKCVVIRWAELSIERFLELVERGAGSLLILLPADWENVDESLMESWRSLEAEIFEQKIPIPVYFAREDDGLTDIYNNLSTSADNEKNSSVAGTLFSSVGEYGYQMMSREQKESLPDQDTNVYTITGKLYGKGVHNRLPTLALLAHYDAIGLATSLSTGTDYNGSGVVALLEIARLFSRLYSDPKQRPKYNLMFILTGGGKFNYFGTKRFLESQLEEQDGSKMADYTLCLEGLAGSGADGLYVHVSKPPPEGSSPYQLINALNVSMITLYPTSRVSLIHKKVRLSSDLLAWEHEQFSLKRVPAATLSAADDYKDMRRRSMFVTSSDVDPDILVRNVKVISEGVARHIYGLPCEDPSECGEVFKSDSYDVHRGFLEAWLKFMSSNARSTQLLKRDHPVISGLEEAMSRYTQDVRVVGYKADKTQPEFVTYDLPTTTMLAHRIKPAVFDLFLALSIAGYSFIWYFFVLVFPALVPIICSLPFPVQVRAFRQTKLE